MTTKRVDTEDGKGGFEVRINGWKAPLLGVIGTMLVATMGGTIGGIISSTRWQGQIEVRVSSLESRAEKQDEISSIVSEIRGQLSTSNSWRSDFSAMMTNMLTQLGRLESQIKDLEMRRVVNEEAHGRRDNIR